MPRWTVFAAVALLGLTTPVRPQETPAKIQFRFGFPPGVYVYRQALSSETFQQMDGRDLMRDHTEMAVTFAMSSWDTGDKVILRFVPQRIEATANRRGFSGRYDSAGPPAAQSKALADHLSPLLQGVGVLTVTKDVGIEGTGIADQFNPAGGGVASMPIALLFGGDGVRHFLMEMHWVIPEKPRGPGERWKSRTSAWRMRAPRDRKIAQRVAFEKVEGEGAAATALFTFVSDMPPAGAATAGAVALEKAEGTHGGWLRLNLATGIVTEYRDETKWTNQFSMSGPMGTNRQVMGNAYVSQVTIARTSTDPGPLPPDLAPAAGGEDEEHADED